MRSKTKTILFIAIAIAWVAIAGIGGCTKPNFEPTPNHCGNGVKDGDETGVDCGGSCAACGVTTGKIKTMRMIDVDNGVSTTQASYEYTYDAQGRISVLYWVYYLSGQPADTIKQTYTYGTNSVIELGFNPYTAAVPSVRDTLFLNAQGYVISSTRSGAAIVAYDAEGHILSSAIQGNPVYTNVYTNGNRTSYTDNAQTITYTYLTDTLEYRDFGAINFEGKGNKNLIHVASFSSGSTDTYSYEYDSKGRVTKETIVASVAPAGTYSYSTYTYFD